MTVNNITGRRYVGSDSKNRPIHRYAGSSKPLQAAIKKYGLENFQKIILETVENASQLRAREEFWLEKFDAAHDPSFYNLTNRYIGGRTRGAFQKGHKSTKGMSIWSADERKRISEQVKNCPRVVCEHCKDSFHPSMLARWHGDRCRQNPHRDPTEPWVEVIRSVGKKNRGRLHKKANTENYSAGAKKGWIARRSRHS